MESASANPEVSEADDAESMAQLASMIRQAVREELDQPLKDLMRAINLSSSGLGPDGREGSGEFKRSGSGEQKGKYKRSSSANSDMSTSSGSEDDNFSEMQDKKSLTHHMLSHRVHSAFLEDMGSRKFKRGPLSTIPESEKEKESNEEKWIHGLRPFVPPTDRPTTLIEEDETALLVHQVSEGDDEEFLRRPSILYVDDFGEVSQLEGEPKLSLESCVQSTGFEQFSAFMVILNAFAIGAETEYQAHHVGRKLPIFYRSVDVTFCVVFTLELLLKLYALGIKNYFTGRNAMWQWLDFTVVAFQITEYGLQLLAFESSSLNVTAFRIARILRLQRLLRLARIVRLVRIVRTFDLIDDLQTIISSMASAFKPLCWALLALFMAIYVFSIFFTHLVIDTKKSADEGGNMHVDALESLDRFYGSLLRTILTMYECVSGGIYWEEAMSPLLAISPFVGCVFVFYIAFCMFALLNVVTGVFIGKAISQAQEQDDDKLCTYLLNIFAHADSAGLGEISWVDFEAQLDTDEIRTYFKIIDVDISEAEAVFTLLDVDGSGSVDALEFVSGCLRLRGSAKAVELSLLLHETKSMNRWIKRHIAAIEEKVKVARPKRRLDGLRGIMDKP